MQIKEKLKVIGLSITENLVAEIMKKDGKRERRTRFYQCVDHRS